MKIKPLKNCGVEILDIDISNLTSTDYKEIKDIFINMNGKLETLFLVTKYLRYTNVTTTTLQY